MGSGWQWNLGRAFRTIRQLNVPASELMFTPLFELCIVRFKRHRVIYLATES